MRKSESYEILKYFSLADLFSIGNAFSGFLSIVFAIKKEYLLCCYFLFIAVFLDFLDGKIARYTGRKHSEFGVQIDSLADVVSFGIAPSVLGFFLLNIEETFKICILLFFIACGISRLARFNVIVKKTKHYIGMPITLNGIIFPLFFIISPTCFKDYGAIVYIVVGLLMISSFKLKKFL